MVVGTISTDGLDQDRLDALRAMGISVRQAAVGEMVREGAARVQATVPFRSENVDRDAFTVIVGLLVAFYYESGRVDPLRALRRSNVDAYLTGRRRPSRRTLRYLLYAAGRVFYPNEYPPALTLDAPRQVSTPPATPGEISALYRVALTLGDKWGPGLTLLVDLLYGVGARPAELKHLRRRDVRVERHHGRRWVVVTLQTPQSEPRDVPVLDERTGERIERYVAQSRHDHLLALGRNATVERNGINRINERLAERQQPERIDAKALRHAWMQEIACQLPLAHFCYLAGVNNVVRLDRLTIDTYVAGDLDTITSYLTEDNA